MHLAHAVGVIAGLGEFAVEAFALIGLGAVIGIIAGARAVLAGKHAHARGHAHGRGRIAAVENNGLVGDGIQCGRDDLFIAQRVDGIATLLIGEDKEHVLFFHGRFLS